MYEYIEEHSYDEMVRKCINEYGKYGRHRVLKEICRKLNVDWKRPLNAGNISKD